MAGPLDRVISFWKPLMDAEELAAVTRYGDPGEKPSRGVNVWRSDAVPRPHVVVEGNARYSLFAAVHPMHDVPGDAQVLAEILDESGSAVSFVLHFAESGAVVVPFDADRALRALSFEEYVPASKRTVLPQPLLSAYYMLRKHVPAGVKDGLRRLIARRIDASNAFLEWPVDESYDLLQRLLFRSILIVSGRECLPFVWFWPEGRPWAAVLTHDVETAEGLARVARVVEHERSRGVRSSFNLVPADYVAPDELIRNLASDGFEVGVHGYTHDGLLFSSRRVFVDRVEKINDVALRWGASGFRSPATYRNLEWFDSLEFEYDSSVSNSAPYEPQPGGCGSLFPYMIGDLVELPITLPQDHTLFGPLAHQHDDAWTIALDRARLAHGMACVLTHPDPASGYIGLPENEKLYLQLVDDITATDAWVPLPRDLARWWRARLDTNASTHVRDGLQGATTGTASLNDLGELQIVVPEYSGG